MIFCSFDHFGAVGAFGLPIAMLVVDIILRILIVEKAKESACNEVVESPREADASASPGANEETPLVAAPPRPGGPSLSFRNFLDTRLMTTVLVEVTISSVYSVFETVRFLCKLNMASLTQQYQTLPLFTIETYQWSPTNAGLVFLGLTLPSFLSIPLATFTNKHGWNRRKIVAIELIVSSLPMAGLKWAEGPTIQHELLFVLLIFLVGLFMTTCQAQVMAEVSDSVRQIEARHGIDSSKSSGMGTGFAFCNMAIAAGQFIGPLIAGVTRLGFGWSVMTFMLGILSLVVGLVSFAVNT